MTYCRTGTLLLTRAAVCGPCMCVQGARVLRHYRKPQPVGNSHGARLETTASHQQNSKYDKKCTFVNPFISLYFAPSLQSSWFSNSVHPSVCSSVHLAHNFHKFHMLPCSIMLVFYFNRCRKVNKVLCFFFYFVQVIISLCTGWPKKWEHFDRSHLKKPDWFMWFLLLIDNK